MASLAPELLAELGSARVVRGFELDLAEHAPSHRRFTFRFEILTGPEEWKAVTGEYYRAAMPPGAGPMALVLVSPILAGPVDDYLASRFVCRQACGRGMSAFFLHQEKTILDPARDALELQAWVEENVRENRAALDLFARLPEIDPSRLGSVGISLGALKNVVLIACEERLRANVLALAGGHLASMTLTSKEALVRRYLRGRRERDDLSPEEVAAELARHFRLDPCDVAPAIDSSRVLLFLARWDDKVPYAHGLDLRRRLGEPETWILPLGHYTSVVAAPWAVTTGLRWIERRLGSS